MQILFKIAIVFFIFIMAGNTPLQAQKVEVEKQIAQKEFPKNALRLILQDFPGAKKMKFYRETAADSTTYEAKFRWNASRYSVEFLPNGSLMDIEKKIKLQTIPLATLTRIRSQWAEDFKKVKVIKCQEQKSAEGIRYEIEVKGKKKIGVDLYEYLFESDGRLVQKRKIILQPNDMTLY